MPEQYALCPQCGAVPSKAEAKFCPACGAALPVVMHAYQPSSLPAFTEKWQRGCFAAFAAPIIGLVFGLNIGLWGGMLLEAAGAPHWLAMLCWPGATLGIAATVAYVILHGDVSYATRSRRRREAPNEEHEKLLR